jgi:predicted nucleotidyltransferase
MKRDEIIATLRAYEPELRAAGVTRLALFGSVARNEAQVGSDIDLLAAFDAGREFSLPDILGIENRLTDLIGHPVDLVEEGTLGPRVGRNENREVVRAF